MRNIIAAVVVGLSLAAGVCAAEDPPKLKLQLLVRGLSQPTHLTHDGTDRLFVCEQNGRIRLIDHGRLLDAPYLDISKKVAGGGECGLLSMAFHPGFARNGLFYVNYTTRAPNLKTIVSEFKVKPGANHADPSTERVILSIDQPYANHNGGCILFGPDGMLYIGMGDGGAGGDPQNRAQSPSELLGKMLRIDVTPRRGYAIPKDNPFVGKAGYRSEIWTMGMRNPWRFSFDRKTGELWAGDVGQNLWEEIDILVKGGNYGWNLREGTHAYGHRKPPKVRAGQQFIEPIKDYGRDEGQSVTGGYVYRGTRYPALDGWYIYGDFASGRIWGLKRDGDKLVGDGMFDLDADGIGNRLHPSSFGEDKDGELYIVNYGGAILHIGTR